MDCLTDITNSTVFTNDSNDLSSEDILFWSDTLEVYRFTVQRVLILLVVIIGVVGNSITILVLTRRHMQSSTNLYLTALAVSDMVYLILVLSLSFQHIPGISHRDYLFYWHYFRYARWLADASSYTSFWLTVTFTAERFIAVCHPIKGKVMCTESRAKKIIVIVYVLCIISTITTPHESNVVFDNISNCTTVKLQDSVLGRHELYKKIFYWFTVVMFILVPLLLLAAFNSMLIIAVKRSRQRRSVMTRKHIARDAQENKITVMLISVVILAMICQIPIACILIYTSVVQIRYNTKEYFICLILGNIFNLLMAINASVNFIFYSVLSGRYRRTFLQVFCQKKYRKKYMKNSWAGNSAYTNFEDGSLNGSFRNSLGLSRLSYKNKKSRNQFTEPLTDISEIGV